MIKIHSFLNIRLLCFLSFFGLYFNATGQDTDTAGEKPWKKGGIASLTFNQSTFINWAAGGENSIALTVMGSGFANYSHKKFTLENNLDASYGIIKGKENGLRKNDDKWEFQSKAGYALSKVFKTTFLLNFKSQFAKGYNYPDDTTVVSRFMAPGYMVMSLGFNYNPKEYFSLFLSPFTGKLTFVLDQNLADQGAYGVEGAETDPITGEVITHGKKLRAEFGAYLNTRFQKEIVKNVELMTKLDLFNNYTDKNRKNRKNIDINWETQVSSKINKFLTTTLITQLIYDHDILIPIDEDDDGIPERKAPRTQFKEVFGVSISYKF